MVLTGVESDLTTMAFGLGKPNPGQLGKKKFLYMKFLVLSWQLRKIKFYLIRESIYLPIEQTDSFLYFKYTHAPRGF